MNQHESKKMRLLKQIWDMQTALELDVIQRNSIWNEQTVSNVHIITMDFKAIKLIMDTAAALSIHPSNITDLLKPSLKA